MALRNAFAELAVEATQQELLAQATILLASILEKMPRVDANDRLVINSSDQGNVTVALASNQSLAGVTTLSNQTSIGGRDASYQVTATANAGVMHIYNNIIVS